MREVIDEWEVFDCDKGHRRSEQEGYYMLVGQKKENLSA